jgi:outer membrane protein
LGQETRTINSLPRDLPGNRINDRIAQPNLTQPITSGGGEFAKLRQAEDLIRQQRATLLQSEETLLANAVVAYTAVLADQEQLAFQIAYQERVRQATSTIARLVEVGDRTGADLAFAQARLAQAKASVATAQGQLDQDRATYVQVIGEAPGALKPPEPLTILPQKLDEAVVIAQDSNPNVVIADFAERAARDGVDIATSALLPSLSLNAFWQNDFRTTRQIGPVLNGPFDQGFVGLQLTVPLYQGGAEYSQIREAKKTAAQLRFQTDSARRAAIATVRQVWAQLETAQASITFNLEQVAAAQGAVAMYQRQLAVGLVTVLELLDSYQQLVGAQIGVSQARQSRIVADFQVLSAIGGLTARSLKLPVSYYDPKGDYKEVKWKIFGLSVQKLE